MLTEMTFGTALQAETFLHNAGFRLVRPRKWLYGTRAAASLHDGDGDVRLVIVERRYGRQ